MKVLALLACAHATFEPRIEPYGAPGPVAPLVEAAARLGPTELSEVWVSMGELPAGVRIRDGEVVVTNPELELVANVSTRYDVGAAILAGMSLGFYRYHPSEDWKNPYCNVQVPLGWLTFTLWTLVPFHYPCGVAESNAPAAVDRRRERIIEALVRATAAAGGNVLVVTSLGDLRFTTITNYGAYTSLMSTTAGEGVALRDKRRLAAPAGPSPAGE